MVGIIVNSNKYTDDYNKEPTDRLWNRKTEPKLIEM